MFKDKVIVIVGIKGEEKKEIIQKIGSIGATYELNLTKRSDLLITRSSNNSKTREKAETMNLEILSPEEFKRKVNRKHSHDESDDNSDESQSKKPKLNSPTNPISIDTNNLESEESKLKFSLVNRETISEQLATLLISQKTSPKGILPILSQHFGSGKTALVCNFRKVLLQNNTFIEKYKNDDNFNSLMKAALLHIDISMEMLNRDVQEQLKMNSFFFRRFMRLLNGKLEFIKKNSNSMLENDISKLDKSLNIVKYLLFGNVSDPIDENLIDQINNSQSIFHFLTIWSKNKLFPLLLFFDEFSCLSEINMELFIESFKILVGTPEESQDPRHPDIFIIVAGKSSHLTKLGRGYASSPVPCKHLILDMLKLNHIQDLINSMIISNTDITMQQLLELHYNVKEFTYFCKVLYQYSGGIPRLVIKTLYSLIKFAKENSNTILDLSSRENINNLFANFKTNSIFEPVTSLAEIYPFKTRDHISIETLKIYYLGLLGVPFELNDLSVELVYELNIGIEIYHLEDFPNVIKLIIPLFIELSEYSEIPKDVLILKSIFAVSQIVDKESLLEVLKL